MVLEAQGIVYIANDLHEAKGPATALNDIFGQAFRGEPFGERFRQINSFVAGFGHAKRAKKIFGNAFGRKAANLC